MAAIAIPIAASSPAWVPWAMTAVGLGGTYLTNKDKIDSSLSNIANFGGLFNRGADDIQWKDGTITTTDGTVVSQPSASVIPIDQTLSTGPLPPSNNKDPNKNISGQARWTAVGELLNKAFPEKKESQVDVASTEAALEPYGFNENFKLDTENLNTDGSIPIVRSEAGKKADAFLAEKEAWLARTANSPAAQAGFSDEQRWNLQQQHRDWKEARRTGTLDEFAQKYPNSNTAKERAMRNRIPSVMDMEF